MGASVSRRAGGRLMLLLLAILANGVLGAQPDGAFYAWSGALLALAWLVVALVQEHRQGRRTYVEAERQRKLALALAGAPCEICGQQSAEMFIARDFDGASLACAACHAVTQAVGS